MFTTIKRMLTVCAVAATMLVVPAATAFAADGCGSGWYKESDGYYTKDAQWSGLGSHSAWIYHSGRVRYCTDDDGWLYPDDPNRRVLIGYPNDSYPLESWVDKWGTYSSFCVTQVIRVYMTGVKSSESYSVGGSIGTSGADVSASYSASYDTMTVTIRGAKVCGASVSRLIARTGGITVTGTSDDSAEIQWVQLTTRLDVTYYSNGTKYGQAWTLDEKDYS